MIASAAKPPPPPNFEQKPMASILKAGLDKPQTRPAPLPVRYAAAAAAAVAPANPPPQTPATTAPSTSNSNSVPALPPLSATIPLADQTSVVATSPSLTHPSLASPVVSSAASISAAPVDGSTYDSPLLSEAPASSPARNGIQLCLYPQLFAKALYRCHFSVSTLCIGSFIFLLYVVFNELTSVIISKQPPVESQSIPVPNGAAVQPQSVPSPRPTESQSQPASQSNGTSVPQPATQPAPQYPPGVKAPSAELPPPGLMGASQQQQAPGARPTSTAPQQVLSQSNRSNVPSGFPGSLSDLVMSFENVKQKGRPSNSIIQKSMSLMYIAFV